MTFLMKDDVNDEMPNGTFKILILFDGVSKLGDRLEVGHVVTMLHIFKVV